MFFFFNDTATTEIYTLSLHDALPISSRPWLPLPLRNAPQTRYSAYVARRLRGGQSPLRPRRDRKSTRLNSSHGYISYAVFCLKKKNINTPEVLACALSRIILVRVHIV